ncbi:hypothetical protein ACFL09_04210 [Planctomycetota bacterium]
MASVDSRGPNRGRGRRRGRARFGTQGHGPQDPGPHSTGDRGSYAEIEDETDRVGIFFRFTDIEATGSVVKEVGF